MLMTSVSASTAQMLLTSDVLQDLARAGCALARHLVAQHFSTLVDRDGAAMQRPDVQRRARFRIEIDGASGMRRHRIEVAGVEGYALPLAGGRDVVQVLLGDAGVLQHLVECHACEFHRVTLADAERRSGKPGRIRTIDLE
jgi:hypothetical protein